MLFLTVLLALGFILIYMSQSTTTLRKIVTRRRIMDGRLSHRDIVAISHKLYSKCQWLYSLDACYNDTTGRFYLSSTGRLYKHTRALNGHISVRFYSHVIAIYALQISATMENPVSRNSSNLWTIYRPAMVSI